MANDWSPVGSLPKLHEIDVGNCLSEHLDIIPKRDTVSGKPILNGASDCISYTDRSMYAPDRSVNRILLQKLDLAFEAMVGQNEITNHRDILFVSGLRGYFMDLWRTIVLNGRNAITDKSLAFICSALVYSMDSERYGRSRGLSLVDSNFKLLYRTMSRPNGIWQSDVFAQGNGLVQSASCHVGGRPWVWTTIDHVVDKKSALVGV